MFFISLIEEMIAFMMVGGGGIFLFQDYKRGFATTKAISEKAATKFRELTGFRESEVDRANRAVGQWGRQVALLRESVASIEANYKIAEQRSREEMVLVSQFVRVEEDALRAGDQDAATAAAMAKIQAEKRASLFAQHAQDQMRVAKVLGQELEGVEVEFDIVRTQAETVRVNAEIAEAKNNLYELTSSIESQTGFTARGLLEQALINTEHEKLKAGALLDMAAKHSSGRVRRFMQLAEVNAELDNARKRIALNPAPPEVEQRAGLPEAPENSRTVEAEIVN